MNLRAGCKRALIGVVFLLAGLRDRLFLVSARAWAGRTPVGARVRCMRFLCRDALLLSLGYARLWKA